ncbi:uncharacterized protein LY89DRAFT_440606 [Mollisia scopiformis]|uniref:Uncharacterized protein n=1 Tax=Mollisia scopiformis TaxID=149040 RepID=A0A194XJJ6_MOLSC|nr:uncharacterized protein LY89DRAFT_440606 [Mollisia scopiformis]KUJ20328.1 hypothetical protein LY89DRAFT_440606 [Mollisia scopiformis]
MEVDGSARFAPNGVVLERSTLHQQSCCPGIINRVSQLRPSLLCLPSLYPADKRCAGRRDQPCSCCNRCNNAGLAGATCTVRMFEMLQETRQRSAVQYDADALLGSYGMNGWMVGRWPALPHEEPAGGSLAQELRPQPGCQDWTVQDRTEPETGPNRPDARRTTARSRSRSSALCPGRAKRRTTEGFLTTADNDWRAELAGWLSRKKDGDDDCDWDWNRDRKRGLGDVRQKRAVMSLTPELDLELELEPAAAAAGDPSEGCFYGSAVDWARVEETSK